MGRRQSLRLVPERLDDEGSGGGEAVRAEAQDEAGVDERPPLKQEPSDVRVDDEIFDDLEE